MQLIVSFTHNFLIAKLSHNVIRGTPLQPIRSYPINKLQYVNLSRHNSNSLVVKCGVSQGCTWSLLFSVYVNDLSSASTLNTKMFANDREFYFALTSILKPYKPK